MISWRDFFFGVSTRWAPSHTRENQWSTYLVEMDRIPFCRWPILASLSMRTMWMLPKKAWKTAQIIPFHSPATLAQVCWTRGSGPKRPRRKADFPIWEGTSHCLRLHISWRWWILWPHHHGNWGQWGCDLTQAVPWTEVSDIQQSQKDHSNFLSITRNRKAHSSLT